MFRRLLAASKTHIVCLTAVSLAMAFFMAAIAVAQSAEKSTQAAPRKVGEAELLLSRPKFIYSSLGKRDPFVSLVTGEFEGEGNIGLVSVGDMELVGILWGSRERLAMVEDSRGRGYVLRVGDAVIGGVVTDITKDSIAITQTFYGETQTVVIRMKGKEGESNEK